jgi:ribosomal 30S subunit maturation factor RimM
MDQNLLIGAIVALVGMIGGLAVYIKGLHEQDRKDKKELYESQAKKQEDNIKLITDALSKSNHVIENNNRLHDKIFQYIDRATKNK